LKKIHVFLSFQDLEEELPDETQNRVDLLGVDGLKPILRQKIPDEVQYVRKKKEQVSLFINTWGMQQMTSWNTIEHKRSLHQPIFYST